MEEMNSRTLIARIAESVLRELYGQGSWVTKESLYNVKKPSNPTPGLSVGDSVYFLDEDDRGVEERKIIAVWEGIGYYMEMDERGPQLYAAQSQFCMDIVGVLEELKKEIEYCREKTSCLENALKSLE